MIGHLLGDFYFQTDKLAEKKKKAISFTILHCLIYTLTIWGVISATIGDGVRYITLTVVIGILHLLIDGVKCIINKVINTEKCQLVMFVTDQLIHIIILAVISYMYPIQGRFGWIPGLADNIIERMPLIQIVILSMLVCGKPASVIVSMVFDLIPKTIEKAKENIKVKIEVSKQENVKIGSWIGILEREIMLILGLLGEYGAIGFVVAAKSLARHSQFDNPAFAEKYLIGTLLSSVIALLCICLCSMAM